MILKRFFKLNFSIPGILQCGIATLDLLIKGHVEDANALQEWSTHIAKANENCNALKQLLTQRKTLR